MLPNVTLFTLVTLFSFINNNKNKKDYVQCSLGVGLDPMDDAILQEAKDDFN